MGLYKNGQPDTAAIKAFQQKNGLPADGKIGPNTSGAILSAAKPGAAGSGRGVTGGPTATQMAQNATPPANEKLGPTNTMPRNPMYAPARPSTGYTAQMAWDQQYGKTHSTSGAPKPATPRPSTGYAAQAAWDRQNAAAPANPVRESNFEESVSRMRRLSTLLKG
jgi:peptidoglycan hydrolase-like protein with peptidoglycan-binding domain